MAQRGRKPKPTAIDIFQLKFDFIILRTFIFFCTGIAKATVQLLCDTLLAEQHNHWHPFPCCKAVFRQIRNFSQIVFFSITQLIKIVSKSGAVRKPQDRVSAKTVLIQGIAIPEHTDTAHLNHRFTAFCEESRSFRGSAGSFLP